MEVKTKSKEGYIRINGDFSKILVCEWGKFEITGQNPSSPRLMLPRETITPREAIEVLKGQEKRTRDKYREILKQELEHIKRVRAEARKALKRIPRVAKST